MNYKTIFKIRGEKRGPKTLLFAGIHGNEYGGIDAVSELRISPDTGHIQGVLANPPAIKHKKRSINRNINRLFGRRHRFRDQSTYEFPLVSELESLLQHHDYLLDIHNSNTPGSPLFLIAEDHSIGAYFDVEYICSGFDQIQPGGTDYYMNSCLGKTGVCLECGYLTDTPREWLQEQIVNFLRFTGNITEIPKTYSKQIHCKALLCYKPKHTFRAEKKFTDFEKILSGERIGYDGENQIIAPKDGFILFMRSPCLRGKEAFIFGEFLPEKDVGL